MRVSKMTVYRLVHGGELPAARVGPVVPRAAPRRRGATCAPPAPTRLTSDPSGCGIAAPRYGCGPSVGAGRVGTVDVRSCVLTTVSAAVRPVQRKEPTYGFGHQEASQADVEEEAPQAAPQDPRAASQARQVTSANGGGRHRPFVHAGATAPHPAGRSSIGHSAHSFDSVGAARAAVRRPRHRGQQFLGGHLAARLAADPSIERVLGVDTVPPARDLLRRMGRAEFVRADIRNPLIAKVIAQRDGRHRGARRALARPVGGVAASATKEMNVIGTMQLLAACQKAPTRAAGRARVDHRGLRREPAATRRCSTRR